MIEKLGYNSDLIAYLDTFLDNHKKSLLLNLQCECSETDLRDIDKDLDVFRKNEKAFYDKVTSSLREYIWEEKKAQIYLFFDIGETIASRSLDSEIDVIRPSLKILLQNLQHTYPNIHFAICSARGQEYVEKFIEEHSEYPFEFWISSKDFSSEPLDESRWTMCCVWHYNKAHAMIDIAGKYAPVKCILVDDRASFWEKETMSFC